MKYHQSLLVILALASTNAFTNYNYIPAYTDLTSCTDTDYHTDCAWNECCGYVYSCCAKDSTADTCDYTTSYVTDGTTNSETAGSEAWVKYEILHGNAFQECYDPYD